MHSKSNDITIKSLFGSDISDISDSSESSNSDNPESNQKYPVQPNHQDFIPAEEFSPEYVKLLEKVQERITNPRNDDDLESIVKLVKQTNCYAKGKSSFDFDLCLLDKQTVYTICKELGIRKNPLYQESTVSVLDNADKNPKSPTSGAVKPNEQTMKHKQSRSQANTVDSVCPSNKQNEQINNQESAFLDTAREPGHLEQLRKDLQYLSESSSETSDVENVESNEQTSDQLGAITVMNSATELDVEPNEQTSDQSTLAKAVSLAIRDVPNGNDIELNKNAYQDDPVQFKVDLLEYVPIIDKNGKIIAYTSIMDEQEASSAPEKIENPKIVNNDVPDKKGKEFPCRFECGRKFHSMAGESRHKSFCKHHESKLRCDICDKIFTRKFTADKHKLKTMNFKGGGKSNWSQLQLLSKFQLFGNK